MQYISQTLLLFFCLLVAKSNFGQDISEIDSKDVDSTTIDSSIYKEDIYDNTYEMRYYFLPLDYTPDTVFTDTCLYLNELHQRGFWDIFQYNNVNAFSPSYRLDLNEQKRIGPRLGLDKYLDRLQIDNLPMYITSKPVSLLYYEIGPMVEQDFSLFHSNNIKPRFNIGLKLDKNYAPGFYSGQINSHTRLKGISHWQSKNLHWQNETSYQRMRLNFYENGGLLYDTLYGLPQYSTLRLMPVPFSRTIYTGNRNYSDWLNRDNYSKLATCMRWVAGKEKKEYNDDSTSVSYSLAPSQYIEMDVSRESQEFWQLKVNVDSIQLSVLGLENLTRTDSLFRDARLTNTNVGFNAATRLSSGRADVSLKSGLAYISTVTSTRAKPESDKLKSSAQSSVVLSGLLNMKVGNNFAKASLNFFLLGSYIGNYDFNAEYNTHFKKWTLDMALQSTLQAPSYLQKNVRFGNYNLVDSFRNQKVQRLHFGLQYEDLKAEANYFLYSDQIYLEHNPVLMNSYRQSSKSSSLIQVQAKYNHVWNKIGFMTHLLFQQPSSSFYIAVPHLTLSSQLYISDTWFDHKLQFSTGIQLDYRSAFQVMPYDLTLNDFAWEPSAPSLSAHNLHYFLNMRISKAKIFLLLSQIDQLFLSDRIFSIAKNYENSESYRYYGTDNLAFRFGVSWLLIN